MNLERHLSIVLHKIKYLNFNKEFLFIQAFHDNLKGFLTLSYRHMMNYTAS